MLTQAIPPSATSNPSAVAQRAAEGFNTTNRKNRNTAHETLGLVEGGAMTGFDQMTEPANERRKILNRLAALEAMTEANGCTPSEAANARRAAETLRKRHGIAETEAIAEIDAPAEDEPSAFMLARSYPAPDSPWQLNQVVSVAGFEIAEHFRCRAFADGNSFVIVGEEGDVHTAHALLARLVADAERQLASLKYFLTRYPDYGAGLPPHIIAAEFRKGVGWRLCNRLKEHEESDLAPNHKSTKQIIPQAPNDTERAIADIFDVLAPYLTTMEPQLQAEPTWAFCCGWHAGNATAIFPGERGEITPPNWFAAFADFEQWQQSNGKTGKASEPHTPARRPRRAGWRGLLDDLQYSTGWAFYRVGWLITLVSVCAILSQPDFHDKLEREALSNIEMWSWFAGLILLWIGEILGGKGRAGPDRRQTSHFDCPGNRLEIEP